MNDQTTMTMLKLLQDYKVEIPIVQRDYAQGRMDSHAKAVRINLLEDMKSAVLTGVPLDLSFVYGKAKGDKFIPIDGQQRLTTLFLLYIYAFYNDETKTDLLKKFTYETRTTSREFFKRLTAHRAEIFKDISSPKKKISDEIKDSEWFISSWLNDPTIKSALVMLDDIVETFKDLDNLAERLCNSLNSLITFKFLEMQDLGMEDSLYIKLNARGKPLTKFENFKAQLIGQMKKLGIPYASEFERLFDCDWTDFFWKNINSKKDFDNIYYAFFGIMLMNAGIIQDDNEWENTLDYSKVGIEIFDSCYYLLNAMCQKSNEEINNLMTESLAEGRTYAQRVMFHAISVYFLKSKGVEKNSLKDWTRIIKNLVLNTEIDNNTRYRNAIRGINEISEYWCSIASYFAGGNKISGFNQEQVKEEQVKAKIIEDDSSFAKELYTAEKHPYFSGQIRSALYLSRRDDGTYSQEKFQDYWAKISALFDDEKPHNGKLLRCSLLTLGDYTLDVSQFKTLCVDDPKETQKTPSLKSLFSKCGNLTTQLLDRLDSRGDINVQLHEIVDNHQVEENDWRICFIKYPELFKWMSISHLRLRNMSEEMHMIRNKWANGYNYNLFLSALSLELKSRGITSRFDEEFGTYIEHELFVKDYVIKHKCSQFIISSGDRDNQYNTNTICGTAEFIESN